MNHEWYVIEDNAGRYLRCRLTGKWIPIEHAAERLNDQQARIEALEKREQMLLAECKIMRVEAERLITKLACDGVQRLTEIRPDAGWDSGEVVAAGYIRFLPEPQETDHE